jgi:O-antigen ligase
MIVISIVLPAMLTARTSDIVRSLFLCFAFASILNMLFVLGGTETIVTDAGPHGFYLHHLGSPGYFSFKNYLGEFGAIAFLLSLHEILYPGKRRLLGIIGVVSATYLVFASNSKTAFGLAVICPVLAGLMLLIRKATRISLAIILLSITLCYVVVSNVSHYNTSFLSYHLYGNPTLSGRTLIWDFAQREIDRRPLLGWGYLSFWLVPGSPGLTDDPGWVGMMPDAHNGYYDTLLEMGYLGFGLLLVFIIATIHAIGRVADHDPPRAWLVLSLALYTIFYNYLESLWMHGFEFLWLVFLILTAEIGRYWQPLPPRRAAYRSWSSRSGSPGPSPGPQTPRLRSRLSSPSGEAVLAQSITSHV